MKTENGKRKCVFATFVRCARCAGVHFFQLCAGVDGCDRIDSDGGGSVRNSIRFLSKLNVCFIVRIWYCSEAAISRCNCCTSLMSFCRFLYSFLTSVTESSTSSTDKQSTSLLSNNNVFSTCVNRDWTVSKWWPAHWTCCCCCCFFPTIIIGPDVDRIVEKEEKEKDNKNKDYLHLIVMTLDPITHTTCELCIVFSHTQLYAEINWAVEYSPIFPNFANLVWSCLIVMMMMLEKNLRNDQLIDKSIFWFGACGNFYLKIIWNQNKHNDFRRQQQLK